MFSTLFTIIIAATLLYYIGMIFYDQYKDKLVQNPDFTEEEEIDISEGAKEFDSTEVTVDSFVYPITPQKEKKEAEPKEELPILPFPWEVEDLEEILENISLDSHCRQLSNVVHEVKEAP